MATTASIAKREACSHTPCTYHHLSCGHSVRVSSTSGPAESSCLANCAHVVQTVSELQSCLAISKLESCLHNLDLNSTTGGEASSFTTRKFICIPCYRARATLALFPTYHSLEADLLVTNPASHVWRPADRLLFITEMQEFKQAMRKEIEKLRWEVGVRRARGDVWGAPLEVEGTVEEGMGLDVEALTREFEGKVVVNGAERVEAAVRGLKGLGLGEIEEGKEVV